VTIDEAISIAGAIAMGALIAVIVKRQIFRQLPIFLFYLAWGLFGTVLAVATMRYFPHIYLNEWIAETCANTVVYLFALAELRNKLIRCNRTSPSGWWLLIFLFVLNGLILKSLSGWAVPSHFRAEWRFSVHAMQATAILELAALLTLIEWAMLRRFRWPDRELRVAFGFGVSAVVEMTYAILSSHPFLYYGQRYQWASLLTSTCDLCVLIYWLWYFLLEDSKMAEGAAAGAKAAGSARRTGTMARIIRPHFVQFGRRT
jgi:hypothetical protein